MIQKQTAREKTADVRHCMDNGLSDQLGRGLRRLRAAIGVPRVDAVGRGAQGTQRASE